LRLLFNEISLKAGEPDAGSISKAGSVWLLAIFSSLFGF
jgi:hypothetical protein